MTGRAGGPSLSFLGKRRACASYPASAAGLTRTFAGDLAVVLCLIVFAWMGVKVHDGIAELASIGRGIQDSGRAIATHRTRDTAGAVDGAFAGVAGQGQGAAARRRRPRRRALRDAPRGATGPIRADDRRRRARGSSAAGREQERKTYQLANSSAG